jgi:acetyl esterase/lipase
MRNLVLVAGLTWAVLAAWAAPAQDQNSKPTYERTEDVIYGRKFGTALTMDVFQPEKQNGYGILFMVSGGFFSAKEAINAKMYAAFLDRGYTVFAVVHGSQPKFHIPEITQDIHRAVRYVRHHAAKYGVNPEKLGITGGSAGGHLSLTMATQGKPGQADAKDPVDRQSSAIGAAACFFPAHGFPQLRPGRRRRCGRGRSPGFQDSIWTSSRYAGRPPGTGQGDFADLFHHFEHGPVIDHSRRRGQARAFPAGAGFCGARPGSRCDV